MLDISQVDPQQQFDSLQQELELYKEGLSHRPAAIVANKIDCLQDKIELDRKIGDFNCGLPVFSVSGLYGHGIEILKKNIKKLFENALTS